MDLQSLLLGDPKLTLAVAESLTCGRVQARVGAISGASEFFLGGITAYSIEQKVRHLGVDEAEARALNGVSADVAEQMAVGVCHLFGSQVGLATTGYAEPYAPRQVVHPFAWWAVAHNLGENRFAVVSGMVEMPGADRNRAQDTAAMIAVGNLSRYLQQFRAGGQA